MEGPIPEMPQAPTEDVEKFKSNLMLLFHNKYRGIEGIPVADITALYSRYFNKVVIPQMLDPSEHDWVKVIKKMPQLKVFKVDKNNNKINLSKCCVRSEKEMMDLAELFSFSHTTPDPENLFRFVVKNYSCLPANAKSIFKARIEPFLNLDVNDAMVPISDIIDHNAPPLGGNNNIFSTSANITIGGDSLATSFPAQLTQRQLLEEFLGNTNPSYLLETSLPKDPEQLNLNVNGIKRKTHIANFQNQVGNSTADIPEKRFKLSNTVKNTVSILNTNSEQFVNISTSVINNQDSIESLARVTEEVIQTKQTENVAAENILNITREDFGHQNNNTNETDMNGFLNEPESGLLLDNNNLEDYCENELAHVEASLNGHADSMSSVSESTCDLQKGLCDNYITPTEFDLRRVGPKLSPNEWVVFQITEDDLEYYKGRQKNCNPKYLDKNRKWELYLKKERVLRLPNNIVVYGEFEEENGKTVFEIVDCTQDNNGSSLRNRPFKERYGNAGKIVSEVVPNGTNGVAIGQKPYFTLDSFLDCQATDGSTKGTLLFVHKGSYGYINPKILRYDSQNPLSELLQQVIQPRLILNPNGDTGFSNSQNMTRDHLPNPIIPDQENNSSISDTNAINDQSQHVSENIVTSEIANIVQSQVKDLKVLRQILKKYNSVLVNVKSIQIPPSHDRSYGFRSPYKVHKCSPRCLTQVESRYMTPSLISTTNPLNLCRVYMWQRKGDENIEYIAPCMTILKTYKQVMDYLLQTDFSLTTDPYLFIDYFSFETEIRDWVELPVWPNICILADISNDNEKRQITCVNEIDHESLPQFEYIKEMLPGENVTFPLHDVDNKCKCSSDQCEINTATTKRKNNHLCDCVEATQTLKPTQKEPSRFASRLKGYDFRRLFLPVTPGIFECNSKCECDQYCGNRVSQSDIKWKLQVFRKSNDWGLRTLHDIPKGHFVCRFVGKVVLQPEAANGKERFQIKLGPTFYCPYQSSKKSCLDGDSQSPYTASKSKSMKKTRRQHTCPKRFDGQNLYVDATHQGNVGRFIDHSSKPNAFIQIVFIDMKGTKSNFNVAIFTKENIYAGSEITADFTNWRGGLLDCSAESVNSYVLNRPGPKGSKGASYISNPVSSDTNLTSEKDMSSQGQGSSDSQSSATSTPCANTLPFVRLEKITSVETTLKEHKLQRLRQNTTPGAGATANSEVTTEINEIKTELERKIPKIVVKMEIIKMEEQVVPIEILKTEQKVEPIENVLKEEKVEPMEIVKKEKNDVPTDNPNNVEENISDVVIVPPPTVEEPEIEIIELASSPEPEEVVDLMSETDVLSIVTPISSRLRSQSFSQPNPVTSSDTPSSSKGVPDLHPISSSSSSSFSRKESGNNLQQFPDVGYSGYELESDYIDYSQHEVKDCMKHCVILNESEYPPWICNNKLFRHQVHGFKRKLLDPQTVVYETACENRYASNREIFEFLTEAMHNEPGLNLSIDNFCFDPTIDCGFVVDIARSSDVYIVNEDISKGLEIVPIRCVSTHPSLEPDRFRYIASNEISEQCKRQCGIPGLDVNRVPFTECRCLDGCMRSTVCLCGRGRRGSEQGSKPGGYTYRQLLNPQPYGIIECGTLCPCTKMLCVNRVAQNDFSWRVEVFNTDRTGWGIRTLQDIPKGAFVCNYVGMLKSPQEAHTGNPQYQAMVMHPRTIQGISKPTERRKNILIIDATKEGNLARFINHSCAPNLFVQEVFFGQLGEGHYSNHIPTIALFSNQNISSNTELTMDYIHTIEDPVNTDLACMCRTSYCREKFL